MPVAGNSSVNPMLPPLGAETCVKEDRDAHVEYGQQSIVSSPIRGDWRVSQAWSPGAGVRIVAVKSA